jgi:hypothetical protein
MFAARALRSFCNAVIAALTLVELDDVASGVESEVELALATGGGGGGPPAPCVCKASKSDPKSFQNVAKSDPAVDVEEVEGDETADEISSASVLRSFCNAVIAALTLVVLDDVELALVAEGGGGGPPAPCACKAAKNDCRSFCSAATSEPVVAVEKVVEDELADEKSAASVLMSLCNAVIAVLTLAELDGVALQLAPALGGRGGGAPAPCACRASKSDLKSCRNAVRSEPAVGVVEVEDVLVEDDELADEKSAERLLRSFCTAASAVLTLVELDEVVFHVEFAGEPAAARLKSELRNG